MPEGIVIIGGGFAGFWAAVAAKRVAGDRADVTLVSRTPTLEIRPRLYEANPETLGVDLRPLLERIDVAFEQAEAKSLDGGAVVLGDGRRLPFARLVLATGSVMPRPPVPGAELAHSIDTQAEAITFDERLAALAKKRAPHVIVIGAGFTGIELALELRDRMAAHGGDGEALQITLLDRANEVGPELGPGPRDQIEAAIREARVQLVLGVTVREIGSDGVRLASERIEADAVVLATGMRAAPFTEQVPGARDGLGRVVVDRDLRAPGMPVLFIAGDAAAADTGDGHLALQSCQHAMQLGRVAGENAARDLLGESTTPYVQQRYVTCLDLGRAGAVLTYGWDRQVQQTGAAAKAVKQRINRKLIYPPVDATREELLALSRVPVTE
ncbi:MAG: FAD-dependent oxidoreductase [Dehalococcoidia bacterium]|nr:FAD-dependent oxidoreductase [Dehalococcoidia bacterium]MCB9486756.1 FAD-dependent oxidoreductase [Thermoflexaceae bacterium]